VPNLVFENRITNVWLGNRHGPVTARVLWQCRTDSHFSNTGSNMSDILLEQLRKTRKDAKLAYRKADAALEKAKAEHAAKKNLTTHFY